MAKTRKEGVKYVRYTVNVPPAIAAMIDERILEIPYNSDSSYFLALALFDCWSRREHKLTAKLMAQPPHVRDEAFASMVEAFRNRTGGEKESWFDKLVKELVEKELEAAKNPTLL